MWCIYQAEAGGEKVDPLLRFDSQGPTEGSARPLTTAAGGPRQQEATRAPTMPKPSERGFTDADIERAKANYRAMFGIPIGVDVLGDIVDSHYGLREWSDWDPSLYMQVGDSVERSGLCGLWARNALMAASQKPRWERVVLTVDSGASDTVLPPSVARNVPLLPSPKVGTEYEVANGGVVVNLGEKKAQIKLREDSPNSLIMSFQVVEVHKPLLAVSSLVQAGHEVIFSDDDPHIKLSNGEKLKMKNNGGTYELEIWILDPVFTGPA